MAASHVSGEPFALVQFPLLENFGEFKAQIVPPSEGLSFQFPSNPHSRPLNGRLRYGSFRSIPQADRLSTVFLNPAKVSRSVRD
jgi:hypothetical protein